MACPCSGKNEGGKVGAAEVKKKEAESKRNDFRVSYAREGGLIGLITRE